MNIPNLSGNRINGQLNLPNLSQLINASRYLTLDINNNVTWSVGVSGTGSTSPLDAYTKAQSDSRFQPIGNYLTSVDWSIIANRPNKLSQFTNDSGFISSEVDTLDSVLGRGNTSSKNITVSGIANFQNQLLIPTTPTNKAGAIWVGSPSGTYTGSTGVSVLNLNDLLDVDITNAYNDQVLMRYNGQWINKTINIDFSNYYTKVDSDNRFQPLGNYLTSVDWSIVTSKPNFITSEVDTLDTVLYRGNFSNRNMTVGGVASFQNELIIPLNSTNKAGAIWIGSPSGTFTGSTGGGGTSDYNQLINRPTNLSQFVNDLNNYGNWLTADGASYAGFASNALDYPYMRHASSGQVIRLLRYDQVTSMAFKNEVEVHKFGTFTADANTVAGHTSNFTYGLNAPFVGTLMHFGASATGTYGTQFNTNYGNGTQLAFRTHNGDNGTWNPWYKIWTQADFLPSVSANGSTVVQRDANGYIFNSYINTTDDIQGGSLGYIVGKLNSGDNYHRSFTAGAVQTWLGLGDLAYLNNSSIDLQFATNRGNATNTGIGIAMDGVANDPYGSMSVTRGQASNYSYYGLTRSGQIGWGIGIDTSNRLVFGNNSSGYSGVFGSIPHAFDASGNANHSNNINAGGSLNIAGASYLKATHVQAGSVFYQYNSDNSLAAQSDMRSDTIHKYVYRTSDGAPLSWKENWYNNTGAVYHSWSTDSAGFVAGSKLTAISGGNGAVTYAGALETRGVNAGITFHYPAYYATSLYMNSGGGLIWSGTDITSAGTLNANSNINAVGHVRSGNWLYSNGNTGWYNETYGGGLQMSDSQYIRTYGSKAFYCDVFIQSPRIHATDKMVIPTQRPAVPEAGCIWIA